MRCTLCPEKNETKMSSCNIFYKPQAILVKFGT